MRTAAHFPLVTRALRSRDDPCVDCMSCSRVDYHVLLVCRAVPCPDLLPGPALCGGSKPTGGQGSVLAYLAVGSAVVDPGVTGSMA